MDSFTLVLVFLGFCLTIVALVAIGRNETEIAKGATRAIATIGQETLRLIKGTRIESHLEREDNES